MPNRGGWRKLARYERGDSLVEFGLSASILLMVVFGVMDCSRALCTYHFVSYAAQEGTRYAIVRGADWANSCASDTSYDCQASATNITSYVQGLAPMGISASDVTVTPSWPQKDVNGSSAGCNTSSTQNSQGCLVKVAVSYTFHFMMPYLPKSGVTMTATSEKVIAY
jgi:Flp pilus assembly protein TadG